jgi:hypothetical protein
MQTGLGTTRRRLSSPRWWLPALILMLSGAVGCGQRPAGTGDGSPDKQVQPLDGAREPDQPRPPDMRPDREQPQLDRGPDQGLPPVCKAARTLKLVNGEVTRNDSILLSDKKSLINLPASGCTGEPTRGAERIYAIKLRVNYLYNLRVTPVSTFNPAVYVLSSCDRPDSGHCIGGSDAVYAGGAESLSVQPAADGTHYIVVDSRYLPAKALSYGAFSVNVKETHWAYFDRCSKAAPITLVQNKLTVAGDTTGARNEYGKNIQCGFPSSSSPFVGPQRYYRLAMKAGKTYKLSLYSSFSTSSKRAVLYLFPFRDCGSANKIDKDCGSNGASGAALGPVASGKTMTLSFKAPASMDHVIAVDGVTTESEGVYRLTVTSN